MEIWKCLQEILELTETEKFWENGDCIGYNLPDGKHHLFIYVDGNTGGDDEPVIVIEPNLIVNGAHEPCGDNGFCRMEDIGEFFIQLAWVIETQCQ